MRLLKNALYKIAPVIVIGAVLIYWQAMSAGGMIPKFMLPSPVDVVKAFIDDFDLLMSHTRYSLTEAFIGLVIGVILGFVIAMVMDSCRFAYRAVYPVLVITQTIPSVALAPLLVLWLGYDMMPKIVLIIITSFFPITIGLLDGFKSADKDALNLLKAMGASPLQRFIHIKVPSAMSHFFAGLRISVSYSIIGAVVAEWLGGFHGLGVYMTRVRKAYAFDKMFAVIFFISALSLLLMYAVTILQKVCMPWTRRKKERRGFRIFIAETLGRIKKMKKKTAILTLIIILIIAAIGTFIVVNNKNKGDKEKITIVLDWTPNTNHTGLFVAEKLGYFEELGLKVEITEPPEGSTTQLIASGKGQFGISFQDTLAKAYAQDEPLPVTVVATILQHNTSGVISLKDKGIVSPKDLEGKKYATWQDPIELAILEKIVTDDGGDFSKIEQIPNTVTNIIAALTTDVDAVWIYKAWDGIALDVANKETNYINFADFGEELDYYTPVLIGNNKYIKENPETTKLLLKAIKKGYEYAIENPEEAAAILLEACPENDEKLVVASQQWISTQYKAEVVRWGYIDKERWDGFFGWLYENKLIEKAIPSGFGFTNDYLPE